MAAPNVVVATSNPVLASSNPVVAPSNVGGCGMPHPYKQITSLFRSP